MAKDKKSIGGAVPANPKQYQPFRYPGGKSKLAVNSAFQSLLYPVVESGDTFYEGFVGSAAITISIALAYPKKKLVVTDLDNNISGFWALIAEGSDQQIEALESLIKAFPEMGDKVEYFRSLRTRDETAGTTGLMPLTLVERAWHALFFNRTTFSGIAMSQPIGGFNQVSEWKIDCRFNASALIQKIRNLRRLFNGRLIATREDCWQWLQRIPPNAPCYLDPPYYVKGEQLYPTAMKSFEHGRLAEVLRGRTNWVMSYDICPEISELYEFAKRLQIPFRYSINGEKSSWNHQNEYVICSPEINTEAFEALVAQQQPVAPPEMEMIDWSAGKAPPTGLFDDAQIDESDL